MSNKEITLFSYYENQSAKSNFYRAFKRRTVHGGEKNLGRRKVARPLDRNKWIHLVLKSKKARGRLSFLSGQNKTKIDRLLKIKSKKFQVKIAEYVNVGNHLHIKVKMQNREGFQKFLKSVTCLIARHVTGARRGKKFGPFWDGLAFTRVIRTSFEALQLKGYFEANRKEISDSPLAREKFLRHFNQWIHTLRVSSA